MKNRKAFLTKLIFVGLCSLSLNSFADSALETRAPSKSPRHVQMIRLTAPAYADSLRQRPTRTEDNRIVQRKDTMAELGFMVDDPYSNDTHEPSRRFQQFPMKAMWPRDREMLQALLPKEVSIPEALQPERQPSLDPDVRSLIVNTPSNEMLAVLRGERVSSAKYPALDSLIKQAEKIAEQGRDAYVNRGCLEFGYGGLGIATCQGECYVNYVVFPIKHALLLAVHEHPFRLGYDTLQDRLEVAKEKKDRTAIAEIKAVMEEFHFIDPNLMGPLMGNNLMGNLMDLITGSRIDWQIRLAKYSLKGKRWALPPSARPGYDALIKRKASRNEMRKYLQEHSALFYFGYAPS